MADSAPTAHWLATLRRNERRLSALWIAGVALLFVVMAFAPARVRLLRALQAGANLYDARWDRRLAAGEQLVAAGRYEDAITYLEKLDAEYPARTSRQGRDKEREHLLRLLAQSYEAGDHKNKAMLAWERLVRFDSLHYRNHFGYALAAGRLLSGWAPAEEARNGFANALLLLPTHLPSLRGYIDYYNNRSEWREVVAAHRTYLDAFLVDEVQVRVGDRTRYIAMRVDGLPHDIDLTLPASAGWSGNVEIVSPTYPLAIDSAWSTAPVHVGQLSDASPQAIDLRTVQYRAMAPSANAMVPRDSTAAVIIPMTGAQAGATRITVRLRMYKLMDAPLFAQILKCYRNLLDAAGLEQAQLRNVSFESPESADAAFDRLDWARDGMYKRGSR